MLTNYASTYRPRIWFSHSSGSRRQSRYILVAKSDFTNDASVSQQEHQRQKAIRCAGIKAAKSGEYQQCKPNQAEQILEPV